MAIKSWICPVCHRDFIVDAESARDTCPWCRSLVEDHDGQLRVVTEDQQKRDATPAPTTAASAEAGTAATGAGSSASGTQSWWPFEYSS